LRRGAIEHQGNRAFGRRRFLDVVFNAAHIGAPRMSL
jgi:hypothetical protein